MKINDTKSLGTLAQSLTLQRPAQTEADFAQTLAQTISQSSSGSVSAPSGATAVSSLMEVSSVGRILAASSTGTQAQAQMEKTLNALDNLAQALGDSGRSLKQISPLVDDLEQSASDLERLGQALPDGHGLKPLVQETAVLASVETAKFRRGDYV